MDIISCQNSVLTKFTDGTPLFQTMFNLWIGKIKIEDLPKIRVGKKKDKYYSIDSRRLFMYKALGIENIIVTEIEWMEEFDSKLGQNPMLSEVEKRFLSDDYSSFRKDFVDYLRFHEFKSKSMDDDFHQKIICIPIKLQKEKNRKFRFRNTLEFRLIMRKNKSIDFQIPKFGKQPIPTLPYLPLSITDLEGKLL